MSKLRTKPKYSHVESVNALFDQIYKVAPTSSDWLTALQQRALNKEVGWKSDADSYVNGLADAGAITPESAAACRDSLERCLGSDPGGREILLPMIWIAIVAAMTMSSQAIANDTAFITLLAVLTSAAGGLWASKRPWLDYHNDPRQKSWKRPIVIVVCAVLVTLLTYFIPFAVGLIIQRVSIEQFNAERAAFLSDQQGFPLLRKLAREQYGVEVVLGDAYRSWAPTTVNLPNSSVALMELQPGYCHLSMRRANTLRGFDPVSSVDSMLWVQGVMMHEFAHCLDGLRDMPIFGQKIVGTHSLAPVDAKKVRDLEGYLEAETHKSTQLWREAVADTFAVGYWKLTAPIAAGDLVASLRHKRANDAPQDATHATMCWIDYADRTDVPASTADLFKWADRLRSSAPCEQPKPKKLTYLQQWVRNLREE